MKRWMKLASIFGTLLALALMMLPISARAAGAPQLRLSASKLQLKVGQKVTLDVLVEDAPQVYGADVRLVFDSEMLEVVDADKKVDGIQVKPGKFLDPKGGFFLQYRVDNGAGMIDYALTLLNPAPPAEGDGVLMQITFRGKADGLATIAISEGLFGTQSGDTIQPGLDQIDIAVGSAPVTNSTPMSGGTPAGTLEEMTGKAGDDSAPNLLLLAGGIGVVGLAGVGGGGWLWLRRARCAE